MTGRDRIWIDRHGGNWSPVDGGTQDVEYIRRDPAVLAALPEVQALIAAAYEVAARETLTLALAIVTDIASTLLSVGDAAGANGLCVLIKTLEQHADTIPKSVSGALTPADATAALAAREAAMIARGMREAIDWIESYPVAPQIRNLLDTLRARAEQIESDATKGSGGKQVILT